MDKKKRLLVIVLLALLLSVTVNAAVLSLSAHVTLDIHNGNAKCSAMVYDNGKNIYAQADLYEGNVLVASWSGSGTSIVSISEVYSGVQSGKTYTLKLTGTVNGTAISPRETTKTA